MTAEVGEATEVSVRYRLPDAVALLASTKRFVSLEVGAMVAMELCERALEGAVLTPARVWLDVIGHLHPSRRGTPGEGLDDALEAFAEALHPVARGPYRRTIESATTGEGRAADLRERFAAILYPIDRVSARTSLALAMERAGRRDASESGRHRSISTTEGTGPDSLEVVLSGLDDTVLRGQRGIAQIVASLEHGPRSHDVAPARYGQFDVFGEIARGGMAQVLLARDPADPRRRPVVLKRMLPALARQESFRQMFKDEARLGLSLEHGNICRTLSFLEVEGQPCIQMEWASGLTLSEVLRRTVRERKPLPIAFVLRVVEAVVAALSYAHDARGPDGRPLRVVHRDVSPQNVIVQYDGAIRLLDFGVARSAVQTEHSEGGQIKGKFAYMSPEQSLGLPLDDRSDVFCVGILMHESLVGRPLFDREDRLSTVRALARGDVPEVRDLRPEVPETISRLVRRTLSSNVEGRPRMKELHEMVLAARAAIDDPNGIVQEVVRGLDPEWRDWRASLKAFDRDPRSSTFPLATPVSQVTRKSTEQPLDPPAAAGPTQKVSSYKLDDDEDTEEDVTALAFRPKAVRDAIRQPPSVTPEPVDFGLDDAVEAKPPQKMRWVVAAVAAALGLGAATWVFTGDDETPAAATSPTNAAPTDETPEPEAPEPAQPVTTTSVPVAPTTPSVEEAPVEETPSVTPESPPEEATGTLPSGTSSLLVQTRPIGARVRIDGVLLPGTTPFRFTELPEGRHRVSIELPGHRPRQQWVRLRPGRGGVIRARLRAAR
ncbi:MAG: protein kinase [Sandaracinus sp.]|nr:protein kinase [Sandaracinus sp.]MCB9634003.1 protein kinase [Sandaracinus sp.]